MSAANSQPDRYPVEPLVQATEGDGQGAQPQAVQAAALDCETLRSVSDNAELLEVGRRAVEDVLVEFRDSRIKIIRGNGLVIREFNGDESSIIRLGPEDALRIGLRAIATHVSQATDNTASPTDGDTKPPA